MTVIYNGIELGILTLNEFVSESVYDESQTDYLYSRISINVTAIVNGQTEITEVAGPPTSYSIDYTNQDSHNKHIRTHLPEGLSDPGIATVETPDVNTTSHDHGMQLPGGPASGPGKMGLYADDNTRPKNFHLIKQPVKSVTSTIALRQFLTVPRRQLFVFTDDGDPAKSNLLLHSPEFGFHTDCKNGPIPKLFAINKALGDGSTFVINFQIETFINEQLHNPLFLYGRRKETMALARRYLLSNRFSMTHILDEDYFLNSAVEGKALFRTDLMYKDNFSPDDFRSFLFLPIPYKCIRTDIQVQGLPDGTGVRYSFVDREQRMQFPGGAKIGAARISAIHRQACAIESELFSDGVSAALSGYERLTGVRANRAIGKGDITMHEDKLDKLETEISDLKKAIATMKGKP